MPAPGLPERQARDSRQVAAPHQQRERRHEQGADHERIQQHAEGQREPYLHECPQPGQHHADAPKNNADDRDGARSNAILPTSAENGTDAEKENREFECERCVLRGPIESGRSVRRLSRAPRAR